MLDGDGQTVGLTSGGPRLGLYGMGGIGKTSLAAELAADQDVRAHFSDVLWMTFGRSVDLKREQSRLAAALGDEAFDCTSIEEGRRRLAHLARNITVLIILDDVWEPEHAKAFSGVGGKCRLLVTTRNRAVVYALDARECVVEKLEPAEARACSRNGSTRIRKSCPPRSAMC
jgi:hypothetical protein